jgi:hypothetical protein
MGAHDPILSSISYADPYITGPVAAAIMQVISKKLQFSDSVSPKDFVA